MMGPPERREFAHGWLVWIRLAPGGSVQAVHGRTMDQLANAFSPVFNPQLIISENSDDVGVETHVLSRVGSYGKQLGSIIDALGVLIARTLDRSQLTPGENRIVDDLWDLSRQVDQAVADYRGTPRKGIGRADIDSVIEGLQRLRHSDPAA